MTLRPMSRSPRQEVPVQGTRAKIAPPTASPSRARHTVRAAVVAPVFMPSLRSTPLDGISPARRNTSMEQIQTLNINPEVLATLDRILRLEVLETRIETAAHLDA